MSGEDFKDCRVRLGLTQAKLAKLLGVNNGSVSRFERGIIPIDVRTEYAMYWLLNEHFS